MDVSLDQHVCIRPIKKAFIKADNRKAAFESKLNLIGYVPLFSQISATIRIAYATLALTKAILNITLYLASYTCACKSSERLILETKLEHAKIEVLNTLGNLIRGVVELIPIFGNIACALYDNHSNLRLPYTFEVMEKATTPLFVTNKCSDNCPLHRVAITILHHN